MDEKKRESLKDDGISYMFVTPNFASSSSDVSIPLKKNVHLSITCRCRTFCKVKTIEPVERRVRLKNGAEMIGCHIARCRWMIFASYSLHISRW